jgi:aspartyl-tRNA synthetase
MRAMSLLSTSKRSHYAGELRAEHAGQQVVLYGWVHGRRDLGKCVFIDLRDREGIVQVVFRPEVSAEALAKAGELRPEHCIGVVGRVSSRGEKINAKMATGAIEIEATDLEIFSRSETPPFPIEDVITTHESLRLKYRYLDLRRPILARNFLLRSHLYQITRRYLSAQRFVEIETPFLVKYTPGGARNFLTPSRISPGAFYALAESPQIFKQLFMVAGMDRYFQIVRCFRDEDLRLDRQPEFTQIDLEMSFVEEQDVQAIVEGLMAALWKELLGVELATPFLRMSYDEAMLRFGSDKPDLRIDLEMVDVTEAARASGFKIFEGAVAGGGVVRALRVPEGERMSRSMLDGLTEVVKPYGGKGVAYARVQPDGAWQATFAKALVPAAREEMARVLGARPGDVLLFVADKAKVAAAALGAVRLHVGGKLDLVKKEWRFLWVTDMPLFEQDEEGVWNAAHHPFTSPRLEDVDFMRSDPGRCRARAYDCVLNGCEVAGGSIRIHQPEVQAKLFEAMGLSDEVAQAKFGFLLEAFRYGPPPHGGIAAGLDRLAMLLCGADSLRDVIAFPKTQRGTDLMTDAPTRVAKKQLDDLHIALRPEAEQG